MDRSTHTHIADKSDEIAAIKAKYGKRYFCEPLAIAEAAALWGAKCNDCGVLLDPIEKIEREHKRYRAKIRLYETDKGYWFTGLDLSTAISGFGTPSSIWDCYAFTDRQAVRAWAFNYLIHRLTFSGETPVHDREKARFIALLEDAKVEQLCLL